jgi:hypothetical protein
MIHPHCAVEQIYISQYTVTNITIYIYISLLGNKFRLIANPYYVFSFKNNLIQNL